MSEFINTSGDEIADTVVEPLAVQLRKAALSGDMPLGMAFGAAAVADELEAQQHEIERLRDELETQRTAHNMWFKRAVELEESLEDAQRALAERLAER